MAPRASSPSDASSSIPASSLARTSAAKTASAALKTRRGAGLRGLGQAATAPLGIKVDLLDETLVPLHAELDHHVDQQIEQALDVRARERAAARALLDEQHELLEGELAASGVHAGDGSRVTRVHVPQVIEGLIRAKLREQNPVGLHAQARLQELFRRHAGEPLVILGIKEPHVVGVRI